MYKIYLRTSPISIKLSTGSGGSGLPGRGITDAAIIDGTLEFTYDQAPFTQNVGQVVGRGITDAAIVGNDLVLTYSQAPMTENVGRVVGDRYATTSTSSITVPNPNQSVTFTVGLGLAYTPQQSVIVANDGVAHFHGTVTSYNATTGVMVVQCTNRTGTGTYNTWTVNLAGGIGTAGDNGWSPTFAVVTDDARRVLQVVDWQGGTGTKPATGLYVGATGLVADIAQGVDVRGSVGPAGPTGATGPQGPAGNPYSNNPNITEYTSSFVASNTFELALQASGGGSAIISEPTDTEETGGSLLTIANNTSQAGWSRPNNVISFNGAMVNGWVFRTGPTLPTTAENYTALMAVGGNPVTLVQFSRSIGFRTVLVGADVLWQCFCTNTTETATTTAVQLAINTNYVLQFSKTGSTVLFYINGTLVATIASNVPAGYGTAVMRIVKTNGTASRTAQLYWYYERYTRGTLLPFITL